MNPGDELSDADCPGLRVRCTKQRDKVFFYRYRAPDGRLRQIKLGKAGPLTIATARKELEKRRLAREQGIDPQAEKQRQREAARQAREAEKVGASSAKIAFRSSRAFRSPLP